jgi:glucan biosynthesis protein C
MESTANERRYDIDWLRVIAIALLLVYHIAIIFQPWAMFIGFIRSEELMQGLWKPMTMLNVWRIPLLFYVSGMGVYFAMRKRNVKALLFERARRIGLPYVFGILAIVPLHILVFQVYYGQRLVYSPHPAHLWFLGNLVIYISILFPLFFHLLKKGESKFKMALNRLMQSPLGPMSVSIFFVLEVLLVKPQIFALYSQTLHGYANGFLAFFFGFLFVYIGQTFWSTMLKWKWLYLSLALSMYLLRLFVFEGDSPLYLMAIESNFWIFGLFGLSYRYLNRPSAALSYLSKAVYPIYIIHMFVLYFGASIILPLALPIFLKFVLIVAFTLVTCLLIYEFILKRLRFLSIPFGMNWSPKARVPTQEKTPGEKNNI